MKSRIRPQLSTLISLFAVVALLAACSKSDKPEVAAASPQPSVNPQPAAPSSPGAKTDWIPPFDSCTLLTKEEVQAVQGEPFKNAIFSTRTSTGISVSQCYFQLPVAVNSIVLTVTQADKGPDARDPAQLWKDLFHREEKGEEKDEERREEGEKEPEKVDGIGDEAFWTGTRVGGALYVLKGKTYIRISVGGAGDQADKIRKSKALAQNILGRL